MFQRARQLIRLLHARPHRSGSGEDENIPRRDATSADGRNRVRFAGENARRPLLAIHTVGAHDCGVDCRGLHHAALWREVPHRKNHRARQPALLRSCGWQHHVVGIDSIQTPQQLAETRAPFAGRPRVEIFAERLSGNRLHRAVEQPEVAQMQHHLRHTAREEHPHRRMPHRTIRQRINQPRRRAIHLLPVRHHRPAQARCVGDGRDVQQQIRRSPKRRVHHHRIPNRRIREDIPRLHPRRIQRRQRARRLHREIQPHSLPARRQRRMRQRKPQRLRDHLRRRRRPEKLTPSARRSTRAAAQVRRFAQRDEPVRKPRADGLNLPRILPVHRRQCHTARHNHPRQLRRTGQRHQHRRKPLVASRHPQHPAPERQRANQPPQHHRRIIPVRQRIKHPVRPLSPAVARVAHRPRKRHLPHPAQLPRRRLHQQADFPMPRMIPQRHGPPVRRPQPALRAQDQKLRPVCQRRLPAHPDILRKPENIPARRGKQKFLSQRQRASRPRGLRSDIIYVHRPPNSQLHRPPARQLPVCLLPTAHGPRPRDSRIHHPQQPLCKFLTPQMPPAPQIAPPRIHLR